MQKTNYKQSLQYGHKYGGRKTSKFQDYWVKEKESYSQQHRSVPFLCVESYKIKINFLY